MTEQKGQRKEVRLGADVGDYQSEYPVDTSSLLAELGAIERQERKAGARKRPTKSVFIYWESSLVPNVHMQATKNLQAHNHSREILEGIYGINSIIFARYGRGDEYTESVLKWADLRNEQRRKSLPSLLAELLTRDQVYNARAAALRKQKPQGEGAPKC